MPIHFDRESIIRFSNALYEMVEEEDGGKCFFEGMPRKNKKDFFDDVKYYIGNQLGIYIWSYQYEDI